MNFRIDEPLMRNKDQTGIQNLSPRIQKELMNFVSNNLIIKTIHYDDRIEYQATLPDKVVWSINE